MSKNTHQLNCYFGIFYSADKADYVLNLLNDTQYSGLNEDGSEIKIDGNIIFSSLNADDVDISTHGFIAVDDMTIEGPTYGSPMDTFIAFDPRALVKVEETHRTSVEIITDIYAALLKRVKGKKNPARLMRMGWQVISCTWNEE